MTTTEDVKPNIYIPTGCKTLDQLGKPQIRCAIQGPPFSGKTTGSLTFPYPCLLSYDKKAETHRHRTDVISVPMYDPEFVNKIVPKAGIQAPVNRKEALLKWLYTEGIKLTPEQTLIADGSTMIEEEYHIWFRFNEDTLASTKTGGKNEFIEWRLKGEYFGELFAAFAAMKCNIIYICHETPDRDKKGELNGKIRPLLTGQIGDKLGGKMTDFFRAINITKPVTPEQRKKTMDWARIDETTLNEWIKSVPEKHDTLYLWQTQGDELCDCGTTSLFNQPKYILANYSSFAKYRKQ